MEGAAASSKAAVFLGAATGGTGAAVAIGIGATICSVGASWIAYKACDGSINDRDFEGYNTEDLLELYYEIADISSAEDEYAITLPEGYEYINICGPLHNQ